ncbi:enoyl-CoA hydratase/isomerase family protein [Fretibacter rubidus]|uniref:enoyl-CoA hydratase/isomerase family protein n=1 Tax=Fretibacter rubidus TaxID=570162 RepID=UPI00352B631D
MTDQIISRVTGNLGHITLNRPQALNALTLDMCEEITRLLVEWERDDSIGAVLIDGAGERAFCAGGDVILLHDSGKAGDRRAEMFWRTEYALNELIHRYSKPYITLIDGFVMGGGVGLSVHGAHRIAGDKTVFAMPETGIGYFPDVGGTYFLPRLGLDIGQWLGLTGARLKTAEAVSIGVANGYVPSEKHAALREALGEAALDGSDKAVVAVINQFHEAGPMDADIPAAIAAFNEPDVPSILRALDGMSGATENVWASKQAASIRAKSPLAMAVTFEAIKRGAALDFRTAMAAELDLSLNFLKTQDFYEGIRAQLIDKDRNPKWSHDSVDGVTVDQIKRVLASSGATPLEFLN